MSVLLPLHPSLGLKWQMLFGLHITVITSCLCNTLSLIGRPYCLSSPALCYIVIKFGLNRHRRALACVSTDGNFHIFPHSGILFHRSVERRDDRSAVRPTTIPEMILDAVSILCTTVQQTIQCSVEWPALCASMVIVHQPSQCSNMLNQSTRTALSVFF